ncbi:DUF84 family protein [Caldalkalibacillus salinus]|uniref:DUF84 family protein n=1 Tax=Caldalkalibacillus salinus TaxID=2803787 RepID=UPI001922736D|nr:DUF84 family protein [Caldalkalibacillus salinus]
MSVHIALGSSSPDKQGYVQEVAKDLELDVVVVPTAVDSGVSEQPLSSIETKTGSVERARQALVFNPASQLSIGIEAGYRYNEHQKYELLCWSTVMDHRQRIVSCVSHAFLLPQFFQNILQQNLPLGEYIDVYQQRAQTKQEQRLADIISSRRPFIYTATRDALLRYFTRHEF